MLSAAKLRPFLLIQKDLHEKSVNLYKICLLSVCFEIWVWQIERRCGVVLLKSMVVTRVALLVEKNLGVLKIHSGTPKVDLYESLLQRVLRLCDKVGKVCVVEACSLVRCTRIEEAAVEAFVIIHEVGALWTIGSVFREATIGIVQLNYRRSLHESAVGVKSCALVQAAEESLVNLFKIVFKRKFFVEGISHNPTTNVENVIVQNIFAISICEVGRTGVEARYEGFFNEPRGAGKDVLVNEIEGAELLFA